MKTRSISRITIRASILTGLALCALQQASAHAALQSSTPAADSTVGSPRNIELHFSEALSPKLTRITLKSGDGATQPITPIESKDPTIVTVMPNTSLSKGQYTVSWSVVANDGHKTQGSFNFTVQ
jgi:methionine-rich copper-binding protein CopC